MNAPSIAGWMAPLDLARSALLRRAGPWLGRWITDRERRINGVAALSMLVTLALTVLAPRWLLALGPVLLGAAHLVSDVRYLAVRPGLHRRAWAWALIGVPLAVGAFSSLGSQAFVWALPGAALLAHRWRSWRSWLAMGVALLLCLCFARAPRTSELVIAHGHNGVAVLLWLLWRPRVGGGHWAVLALFVVCNALLLSGALDEWVQWSRGPASLLVGTQMNTLAPLPEHIELSRRLVLSFAFSQSVHYALWLRAIPETARRSKTPRSFRQSVRGLERDLGRWGVLVSVAVCAAIALWAALDLRGAREGYLRLALFHGYFELAVLCWLFAAGRTLSEHPA